MIDDAWEDIYPNIGRFSVLFFLNLLKISRRGQRWKKETDFNRHFDMEKKKAKLHFAWGLMFPIY